MDPCACVRHLKSRHDLVKNMSGLAAATLLRTIIGRLGNLEDFALAGWHSAATFALVESFAGDDAVNFCMPYQLCVSKCSS
jgi:hypothetical protein